MEEMEIETSASSLPETAILTLKGPFTLSTMFELQSTLRDPALKGAIIDMSGVPYMDSAGLGVLLGGYAHAQRSSRKFALAGMCARVKKIFEITHTDKVLPIYETLAEAEAAVASR